MEYQYNTLFTFIKNRTNKNIYYKILAKTAKSYKEVC
jgi:hypothetical protein